MDSSSTSVESFKYNSSQPPSFSVVETPFQYRSFAHINSPIDVSFSSYLKHEQSQHSQDAQCVIEDSEINVFDAQKYFSDPKESKAPIPPPIKHNIAETSNDAVSRLSSVSSVDGYGRNIRVRSFHGTPTASSEASWNSQTGLLSNPPGSIAVSLRNISADHHGKRRGNSSGSKWFFCRKCPCTGKSSLQVEEGSPGNIKAVPPLIGTEEKNSKAQSNLKNNSQRTHERTVETMSNMFQKSSAAANQLAERVPHKVASNPSTTPSENHFVMPKTVLQQRVSASSRPRPFGDTAGSAGGFSFPILNSSSFTAKTDSKILRPILNSTNNPMDDPPRESLEVFQPPENSNLRRSLEDDVASDASSDLFEIESFTTQTTSSNYPMYRRRDSLDDASTLNARRLAASNIGMEAMYGRRSSLDEPMTPRTDCYAPSEASIDWSVTTAEGFDKTSMTNFSISASEFDDLTILRHRSILEKGRGIEEGDQAFYSNMGSNGNGGNNEGGRKKMGNGLLSCRHEKAVSVGPHPVKWAQEGPPLPLISTSGHVSTSASRPPRANPPPSARGHHSARLSLAFAA